MPCILDFPFLTSSFSLLSTSHTGFPRFPSFSFSPLACPSLFLLSLSLSGCPLADKSLRSLMAAHTPELKYVCSSPLLPFHCHLDALLPTPSYTGMPCFNASFAAAAVSLPFVLFVMSFLPDHPWTRSTCFFRCLSNSNKQEYKNKIKNMKMINVSISSA